MAPRIALPPPLTRGLLLALLSLSTLNAALRYQKWNTLATGVEHETTAPATYLSSPRWAVPYLVLIPSQSLKYPWTFLTSALIENNIVSLIISSAVVWFGGKYLERAWGRQEFAKFVLFVTMIPNITTFFLYALWHAIAGQSITALSIAGAATAHPTPINGLLALSASFLVSLKQLIPEHTVSLFNALLRIRIKHFPALFVLANMLSGPLLGTDTATWLSLFGFLTGWIYLRFYRIADIGDESSGMRGDASETFAFVSFFPEVVHPVMAPVCDRVYEVLVQVRVCTPFEVADVEAVAESAGARREGGLPGIMVQGGGKRAEAERRRALALRALDQRLNAAAAGRIASAPVGGSAVSAEAPDEGVRAGAETEGKEAQA